MKFKFAYEKLLEHRKTLEEIARKEFLLAQALVHEAERQLQTMYDDITEAHRRAGALGTRGGDCGAALAQIDLFINGHKIRIERQRQRIRQLLMDAEAKQAALVEAAREHKTLLKLKDKQLEEFRQALKKRELREIDEIVTTRYKRESY